MSKDIKFSETQLPRIIQLGLFLGELLGKLMKICVTFPEKCFRTISFCNIDVAIQRKILGRGVERARTKIILIISN